MQRWRSRCSGLGGSLQTARPVGSPAWLCCSRNGVSYHIATPRVWVASAVLQQGNHLHQTGFLAAAAVPLCQLQCVGWHIAETRGAGEGWEAEPCGPARPQPRPAAGPGSAGTSLCGDADSCRYREPPRKDGDLRLSLPRPRAAGRRVGQECSSLQIQGSLAATELLLKSHPKSSSVWEEPGFYVG